MVLNAGGMIPVPDWTFLLFPTEALALAHPKSILTLPQRRGRERRALGLAHGSTPPSFLPVTHKQDALWEQEVAAGSGVRGTPEQEH